MKITNKIIEGIKTGYDYHKKERTEITWRLSIGLANSSPIGGDGWPGLLDMTLGAWEFSPYNTVSLEISPSSSVNR